MADPKRIKDKALHDQLRDLKKDMTGSTEPLLSARTHQIYTSDIWRMLNNRWTGDSAILAYGDLVTKFCKEKLD